MSKQIKQKNIKKDIDDDIYLTRSFKPIKIRTKITKVILKYLLIAVLLFITFLLINKFIIQPIKKEIIEKTPEKIFEKTFTKIFDTSLDILNKYEGQSFLLSSKLNIETNNEKYTSLNNKFKIDIYNNKNTSESKEIYAIVKDNDYSITKIKKGNKNYINYSNSKNYLEEVSNDNLKNTNISIEDIKLILDKSKNIIKNIIISDNLAQEEDEILIATEKVSVTRNTLTLNKTALLSLRNEIINDSELLDLLIKITDDENLKSKLQKLDFGNNYTIKINIYTDKDNNFVGIDFEQNGFRKIYYYNYNNIYNIYINVDYKNNYILEINGTKKEEYIDLSVSINNKVGKVKIYEISKNKLSLDYNTKNYSGNIDWEDYNLDLSINYKKDDKYFNTDIKTTLEMNKTIEVLKEDDKIIKKTNKNSKKELNKFLDELNKANLENTYETLIGLK